MSIQPSLRRQAVDLDSVISSVRGYYASNVVGRILATDKRTQVAHNYENIPGAIPIPATLSLELSRVINEQQQNIGYRFVSDYPFANRTPHVLDEFEKNALTALRVQRIIQKSATFLTDTVRLVAPVLMGAACVNCHNAQQNQRITWPAPIDFRECGDVFENTHLSP
jgi:adenylate cyclase